ncbi:MAG: SurA N-terminal domain-containing protein, partial [Proteobacteria bacterium]|nr:SurA N-terminal domain-containing protein [Pseudomonadota bacterium]
MLKYLRDASERPLAKILMGVLIFSFVGWGAANWILGQGNSMDNAIMRIGGTPLKLTAFEQERNRALQGLTRDQQKQIYADRDAGAYFSQQILTKLSTQIMLDKRADALGLTITDAGIAAAIRSEPVFQENGRFSASRFDAMLANSGMTDDAFAAWMRASVTRDMLVSAVSTNFAAAPDFVVTAMYNARYAMRNIQFAAVPFA